MALRECQYSRIGSYRIESLNQMATLIRFKTAVGSLSLLNGERGEKADRSPNSLKLSLPR